MKTLSRRSKIFILTILAFSPSFVQLFYQSQGDSVIGSIPQVFVHILVPIIAVIWIKRLSIKQSILLPITAEYKNESKRLAFLITIIGSLGSIVTIYSAYKILGIYVDFPALVGDLEIKYGITKSFFISVALWITFVNPFIEEFFWRGFVFRALNQFSKNKLHSWHIIIIAGAMFALHHAVIMWGWFTTPLFILVLTFLGLAGAFFNWTYYKTGTIIPAIIIHFAADATISFIGLQIFGLI
jgi:membrane protease YdiL (CAAX protease family)